MDRNRAVEHGQIGNHGSLSARRAWIEIAPATSMEISAIRSLSARRAWIEIIWPVAYDATGHGRSPQGERG